MNFTPCFLWGTFGGLLPEILRLRNIITNGQQLPSFSMAYLIISVVFILAAGIFAAGWKAESPYKAMWIGASLPILVSTMIQSAPSVPR
jgi:hypothetical protein